MNVVALHIHLDDLNAFFLPQQITYFPSHIFPDFIL